MLDFIALNDRYKIVLIFALTLSAAWVLAQSQSVGLDLQQYPNARVVFQNQAFEDDYVLALGSFKKIEGLWNVDRQQRLRGQLARTTLELPSGHSAEEGFEFYKRQLQDFRVRQLYRCDARECGPSNSWANNHFKVIQLYGSDQHQHYAAYEVIREQQPPYYVSLYSVLRGNKRVYVQVEILRTDKASVESVASDPAILMELLLTRGYYVFPDLIRSDPQGNVSLNIRKPHLQTLVALLQRQPHLNIALVGHDYGPGNLARQQESSSLYAEALKAALVKEGVAEQRLSVYGLGSLAPAGRENESARVEVVIAAK